MLEQLYKSNILKNAWLLGRCAVNLQANNYFQCLFRWLGLSISTVERTIGILKGRWKILSNDKRSRYSPDKIALFGNACAALHNLCIQFKVPQYTDISLHQSTQIDVDTGSETHFTRIGSKIRDHLKISLLNNV